MRNVIVFSFLLCLGCGTRMERNTVREMPIDETKQKIDIQLDGQLFTTYHFSDELEKPVLWPLISANGHALTRGYPVEPKAGERVDHPHHLGVWLNYGDVNGLDFWNNSKAIPAEKAERYGVIRHREITRSDRKNKEVHMTATADWNDHAGNTLLNETTQYDFRAEGQIRIIDRTTVLTAVNGAVDFTDNKEGMFGIRVARELELPNDGKQKLWGADGREVEVEQPDNSKVSGDYLSSESITGGAVWGTRASWMKLSGKIEGDPVAIVIYDHPDNVGYPTYWHARTYGLFAANPLGQKVFTKGEKELNFRLNQGESVTFKFRVAVFSSDPTPAEIEALGKTFK